MLRWLLIAWHSSFGSEDLQLARTFICGTPSVVELPNRVLSSAINNATLISCMIVAVWMGRDHI
jgi:hypothetical protein